MTWVAKLHAFREIPAAVKTDPPPLTTGILFARSEKHLADPYRLAQGLFGTDTVPGSGERAWRDHHSAKSRECSLCPGEEAHRLLPCCACENWVHLECSYGIPEGRLCASHCQVVDPLKGVVVTDFNSGKDELRCLVPWRPWVKKYKIEWWHNKGAGKGRYERYARDVAELGS